MRTLPRILDNTSRFLVCPLVLWILQVVRQGGTVSTKTRNIPFLCVTCTVGYSLGEWELWGPFHSVRSRVWILGLFFLGLGTCHHVVMQRELITATATSIRRIFGLLSGCVLLWTKLLYKPARKCFLPPLWSGNLQEQGEKKPFENVNHIRYEVAREPLLLHRQSESIVWDQAFIFQVLQCSNSSANSRWSEYSPSRFSNAIHPSAAVAWVIIMGYLLVRGNSGGQMKKITGKQNQNKTKKARECNNFGSMQTGLPVQLLFMQLSHCSCQGFCLPMSLSHGILLVRTISAHTL